MKKTILHCHDPYKTFILDTDAFKCRIEGVLSQIGEDGTENVINFASNRILKFKEKFCPHERSWKKVFAPQ